MVKKTLSSASLGFTLVELLVVIGMLAVLLLALIVTFNPLAQFDKAKDSQREHDLGQIQRALDTYFNDTGCYPTSLTFGSVLKDSKNTIYMEKVPQDPDCTASPSKCYAYEVPSGTCPQWNILFGALRSKALPNNACPLVALNSSTPCEPPGFSANGYNLCLTSGSIDCAVVASSSSIGGGTGGTGGTGGGGGGVTPAPTPIGGGGGTPPTPTNGPVVCQNGYFGCTGNSTCSSISPITQCQGHGGTIQCVCDAHCNQMCTFN